MGASRTPKAVGGVCGLEDKDVDGGYCDSVDEGLGDDSADEPLSVGELSEFSGGLAALHHEYAPLKTHASAFRMRVRARCVGGCVDKTVLIVMVADANFQATHR